MIRDEIRSGRATRERKLAVCSGGASLPPGERAELLTLLAKDLDPLIAERAASVLLTQPLEGFLAALAREDVHTELLHYCARNLADKPGIADALAKRAGCPSELLVAVARHFSASTMQSILEDLGRLADDPSLVEALAEGKAATLDQRQLLQELQQGTPDVQALAEVLANAEPDAAKRETLLQRLSRMRVVERVKLALTGNREERIVLIRDNSKVVQRAVITSPKLTDAEVESFATMTNISEEALRILSKNRKFIKNYLVVRNLLNNPKVPLDVTLHLLPRLNPLDLKNLTMNKNIPETLRATAQKLRRQRVETK